MDAADRQWASVAYSQASINPKQHSPKEVQRWAENHLANANWADS